MSARLPLVDQVLQLLSHESAKGPMTVRQIASELGLTAGRRPALRRLVQKLVDEGQLISVRGRRFGSHAALGDTVGRFIRHRMGFGFVTPDDPTKDDLFIPPESQAGAMHGDVVAARLVNTKPDGRKEGEILRVVERKSNSLVGLLQVTYSGGGMVEPLDSGYGFEVLVPKGRMEGALGGEVVRVELDEFPDGTRPGRGRVLERLGRPNEPGLDIEILIRKYDLTPEFPKDVEAEVAAHSGDPSEWPLDEREDFSSRTVVTIDGETAKDFDDAVEVERLPQGGYRLNVHIADVAHFVPEGSATDREALRRGTSVYFPGRVVPMLPERLSNELCSLVPGKIRLTQGLTIEYDAKARVKSTRFHDGFIRSHARLTYREVAALLDGDDDVLGSRDPRLAGMLGAAGELAGKLSVARRSRGAIDFDLPEPEILLALTGETTDIVARSRNSAHLLIEEFMIAANEAVAVELKRRRQPAVYRVHERPDSARVARFAEAIGGLGYIVAEPYESLEPRDLARIVKSAAGTPEEPFVQRVVLRAMALARYDPQCLGHFGLALRKYLHFTSPIRRYPDLIVHRALRGLKVGPKPSAGERAETVARLPELARECSLLERDAESAEREAMSWKMAAFMAERLGDEFDGRIVDIAAHGLTVLIEDPFVEGLVPIRRIGQEYYRYDSRRRILTGADTGQLFKLGQKIKVRVDRVDLLRHLIDLAPAEASGAGDSRGGARKPKFAKPGRTKNPGRTKKKRSKSKRAGRRGRP